MSAPDPERRGVETAGRLDGRRVLVTHGDRYTGPAVAEPSAAEGAEVTADEADLAGPRTPTT